MQYAKYTPAPVLRPFVECYFIWEGELSDQLTVESPPNGFCSIAFNYGDPYFISNKKYAHLDVPAAFIAGQAIYSYSLYLKGKVGIAGIVFKPAALATLYGLKTFELTEERIALGSVIRKDVVEKYAGAISHAATVEEKVRMLESFVMLQYELKKPVPDFIDEAANRIGENRGLISIPDLIKDGCMSRRTFERHFFQKVGLSPKYYARIRRVSALCNMIAGKQKVNWTDVLYEAEYYDQAHFIKDFEEFTGRSPQQYLNENTELAQLVPKPAIKDLPDSV